MADHSLLPLDDRPADCRVAVHECETLMRDYSKPYEVGPGAIRKALALAFEMGRAAGAARG